MTYTVVDSDAYPASGIETLFFPGGEPHAKVPEILGDVLLFVKPRTWQDTGLAACVWNVLQRQKENGVKGKAVLFMPYFPGARQDKYEDLRAGLTLNIIGYMFSTGSGPIHVFDPHSPKIYDHIDIAGSHMPANLKIGAKDDVVGVIAPDAGAILRAFDFKMKFYPKADLLCASKERDPQTGKLSNYVLPELKEEGRYIIVDDICDGGGTFNLLAHAFFSTDVGSKSKLELFVSHGIFSKGLYGIDSRIEHITTTDSWCQIDNPVRPLLGYKDRLTLLSLDQLFDTVMR